MAEVVAVVAVVSSAIAIVQISDRIIGLCKFYIETAQDASPDLRTILIELSMLKTIFENLEFLTACGNGISGTVRALFNEEGPIEGCRRSISELEKLFPRDCVQDGSKRQKVKSTFAALAWPLKQNKARKLLDEIMRHKTTVTLALTTDSIQDIKDIKTKASELHEILTDNQRQDVCKWLQHTDPSPLHNQAQRQYEPKTGDWMLRYPEWNEWLDTKHRCLWIHGIPGAGKTVLMSHLFEQVKQHCENSQDDNIACVSYYCYYARQQDEAVPFLRWLLNQLCRQAESVPGHLYKMYKRGGEPSLIDLLKALAEVLDMFDLVYIMVDAIDESMPREDILRVFRDLITDSRFGKIQLLASSREYIDIERTMEHFSVPVSMANPFNEEDIRLCVQSLIQSNPRFKRWPGVLLDEIEVAVSKGAKGMFRWAVCQLELLQRMICDREIIRKALANLPKTLDETYDRIFSAIPEEERVFVHHALQWIHYHGVLYNGEGIPCVILLQAIAKSTAGLISDHGERFYDNDALRELCGCLIGVTLEEKKNKMVGGSWSILCVSYAHYTVREYLDSARVSEVSAAYFAAYPENLMQSCLKSVLSEALRIRQNDTRDWCNASVGSIDAYATLQEDFNTYCVAASPLTLLQWTSEISQDESLCAMALEVLNPSGPSFKVLSAAWRHIDEKGGIYLEYGWGRERFFDIEWDTSPRNNDAALLLNLALLYYDSGCISLTQRFLEAKVTRDFLQSPLHFKSSVYTRDERLILYQFHGSVIETIVQFSSGGEELLRLLLEYGKGFYDPSKLLCLATGFLEYKSCADWCILDHLLDLGADPNTAEYQCTPLQIAVVCWDLEAVNVLLEAGADPNGTPTSNRISWDDDSLMSIFQHLECASPLYIIRNFELGSPFLQKDDRQENVGAIETALLEYGAEEFWISDDESDS